MVGITGLVLTPISEIVSDSSNSSLVLVMNSNSSNNSPTTINTSFNNNRGNKRINHTNFKTYGSTRSNNTIMSMNIGNNKGTTNHE